MKSVNVPVAIRNDGSVLQSNSYRFTQPTSESHLRAADVLRKFANERCAKFPEALRGTHLPKHVAVLSQDLKNNELDVLAQSMGHDGHMMSMWMKVNLTS